MLSDILDENWYEGVLHGKTGVFPVNFVKVSREFIVFLFLEFWTLVIIGHSNVA